jgi:hypothetical protein
MGLHIHLWEPWDLSIIVAHSFSFLHLLEDTLQSEIIRIPQLVKYWSAVFADHWLLVFEDSVCSLDQLGTGTRLRLESRL